MTKETVIAIVLVIILGAGIGAYVLFRTGNGEETKVIPVANDDEGKKVVKTVVPIDQQLLEITSPKDKIVSTKNTIKITGKAQKNSLIVVQSPVDTEVFKTDAETFSTNFPLSRGENVISISVYSDSSTPQEVILTIYFVET